MAADGRFHIYRDEGGEWRWTLTDRNGKIIADSGEGYESEPGCRRGARNVIETIRGEIELAPDSNPRT